MLQRKWIVRAVLVLATVPAFADEGCPNGLPAELLLDCIVKEASAEPHENFPVAEKLQEWMDKQQRRDPAEREAGPAESAVMSQDPRPKNGS